MFALLPMHSDIGDSSSGCLSRACRGRPRGRRAEQHDELAGPPERHHELPPSQAGYDRFALLGTLLTQAHTRAFTLQFAVRVVGWIEFQAAVLACDAGIIVGAGGLDDNAIG